ncbi:hypothetical protein LP420_15930 [Massilia sp. B-10]|nr:hypothetical protein LP420_15930 [Massilia sp. B-10]
MFGCHTGAPPGQRGGAGRVQGVLQLRIGLAGHPLIEQVAAQAQGRTADGGIGVAAEGVQALVQRVPVRAAAGGRGGGGGGPGERFAGAGRGDLGPRQVAAALKPDRIPVRSCDVFPFHAAGIKDGELPANASESSG